MAKKPNAGRAGSRSGSKTVGVDTGSAKVEVMVAPVVADQGEGADLKQDLQIIIEGLASRLDQAMDGKARLEAAAAARDLQVALLEERLGERDRRIETLEASLAAAGERCEALGRQHETDLSRMREEFESLAVAVRAAQAENDSNRDLLGESERRIEVLAEALTHADKRVGDLETSLERTTDLQRRLETEFDQVRRQFETSRTTLTEARAELAELRALLEARESDVQHLRAEAARRGAPGSPVAVGRALADLFRNAQERRRNRIAINEPWRLPPNFRR